MRDLVQLVKDWFTIKTSKNPSPELEEQIRCARVLFHEKVSLLRLSSVELINQSNDIRFGIIEDLINDVARRKR